MTPNRSRRSTLRADGNELLLTLSRRWLEARPLLHADLGGEPDDMAGLGITLAFRHRLTAACAASRRAARRVMPRSCR